MNKSTIINTHYSNKLCTFLRSFITATPTIVLLPLFAVNAATTRPLSSVISSTHFTTTFPPPPFNTPKVYPSLHKVQIFSLTLYLPTQTLPSLTPSLFIYVIPNF